MFRKFQEITFNVYFHDSWSKTLSDLLAIFYVCTLLGEFGSLLYCGIQICNDGWTRVTTPWMVSIIVFWITFIISVFICECGRPLNNNYNNLDIESKRYVFKVSVVLFFHLLSCGFMAVILPFMILISTFNILTDRISRLIFPDKQSQGKKDLSEQFNSLIRTDDNGR